MANKLLICSDSNSSVALQVADVRSIELKKFEKTIRVKYANEYSYGFYDFVYLTSKEAEDLYHEALSCWAKNIN